MITKIVNYNKNSEFIKSNKMKNYSDNNAKILNSSTQVSFKGISNLSENILKHTTSNFGKKVGRFLEESADSIKSIFIKLKGADELPFSKKPLIAPETYDELVALAESGNKQAEATLAIVDKLKYKDIYVSKYDDLFTSDGKFTESAAHNFADSIMLHKPSDGVDLMKNINNHMDYKYLGNLDKDIDYLSTLKNNGHFDTYADKLFNPEHRTNLTYTEMRFNEKFPPGSMYEAQQAEFTNTAKLYIEHPELAQNDIPYLKEHPQVVKNIAEHNPDFLEQYPELAKSVDTFSDDHIHEHFYDHSANIYHTDSQGFNKISQFVGDNVHDGFENLTGKMHEFGSNIGDGLRDGFEHVTDGIHETIGNITSHFDVPEIKVPDFDFNFSDSFEHIKDILENIWDWLT